MIGAQRILVYRLGSLGDTCVALPALRIVRQAYPEARVTLFTNLPVSEKTAPAVALLEGMGLVDDYLAYPVGVRDIWALARLLWRLRRRRFQVAVNLTAWRGEFALRRDARLFRLCGIRRRLGFKEEEARALRFDAAGQAEHEAKRLLRRVAELGQADLADQRWYNLDLTTEELQRAGIELNKGGINGDYLAFSLGTKVSTNDWEQQNWRQLIRVLGGAYPRLGCVFVGAAGEAERVRDCLEDWPGPKLNLCGQTSPRGSATTLAAARVFVGHDSGPMHLAAAVGTPCVAIFSARNPPGQWFPLGQGHEVLYHKVSCALCGLDECLVEQKRCIRGVTVDEVVAAVMRQLERSEERSASDRRNRQQILPENVR